jgi:anti-sigma B factor antagonist
MAAKREEVVDLRDETDGELLAPVGLAIAVWSEGPTTVVRPSGEIDVANAADLKRCVTSIVEQGGTDIVIDLGRVTFVDSTGLSTLVSSLKLVQRTHGRLRLSHVTREVERVLALTGLNEVFELREAGSQSLR